MVALIKLELNNNGNKQSNAIAELCIKFKLQQHGRAVHSWYQPLSQADLARRHIKCTLLFPPT